MKTACVSALCAALLWLPLLSQGKPMTYPQLMSTKYAAGEPLPADFRQPNLTYDFVDTSKLPAGVTIRSAAKARNGVIWVVTDRGPFRSKGDTYVPLEEPRSFKPVQPQPNPDTEITAV